jgi:hypothetical protein
MFCLHCGSEVPDESKFCRKCGQSQSVSTSGGAAAAVAPARVATPAPVTATRKPGRFIGARLVPLLVLLALVGVFMRQNFGAKATAQIIATAVRAPVEVKNYVENVRAASWKGIALNLPYSGTVNVSLDVVNGNPLDVFLTSADQVEVMKKEQWSQVQVYSDFNATKTRTYRRSGHLNEGSYYLVLRDTSLGILSSSASDISVKVQLNP